MPNTVMETLDAVADAIVDAVSPPIRRALSPAELEERRAAFRARAEERRRRFGRARRRHRGWVQLDEDEIVALVRKPLVAQPSDRATTNGRAERQRAAG